MKSGSKFLLGLFLVTFLSQSRGAESRLPDHDHRGDIIRDTNTRRDFTPATTRLEWESRARQIRENVLVSCGLWPLPPKTPLHSNVFGKIERDGYSIEKVSIETMPGLFLAGNLYRPLGKGKGPFPAILNPHGHWANGRFADDKTGSIAARCIQFARLGMVAFSYDMVGYNDTTQVTHGFGQDPKNQLWNISLMGLQTWNGIRALDFLESLADVDAKRLACTGESGGGTQTFMLGAIDDRLAAQAPVVMVSHTMQGGCLCENAPGLRVDYFNVELAAAPAPRPQIIVGATGDWTKTTMEMEGPAMESIYKLFDAPENFRFARFDYPHNYNRQSREAVYEAFGKWLLGEANPAKLKEIDYIKEPDADLRVFPDGKPPPGALDEAGLIAALKAGEASRFAQALETKSAKEFHQLYEPLWRHALQLDLLEQAVIAEIGEQKKLLRCMSTPVALGRSGKNDRVTGTMLHPNGAWRPGVVVLLHPEGAMGFLDTNGEPRGLAKELVRLDQPVLLLDRFAGRTTAAPKYFTNFYTTYNRTELQERVQDVLTACAFAAGHGKTGRAAVYGEGSAGLVALLASPALQAVAVDCDQLSVANDDVLMKPEFFAPGLRGFGAFEGAAALSGGKPLLLHNTGSTFETTNLESTRRRWNSTKELRISRERLADGELAEWLAKTARQ
jgi:dienelactone hydrolase